MSLWSHGSFLRKQGWYESFFQGKPTDRSGNPLPWYTYSAIAFLGSRINRDMHVFEYGSGNSTLWWSHRVARVVACEHDESWVDRMRPLLPINVTYEQRSLEEGEAYPNLIREFPAAFHLVVIDGRRRVECAKASLKGITKDGVIVWDNSDREAYAEGLAFLARKGFKKLDFWGPGPVNRYSWCTSILYRTENCLEI